MCRHHPNTLCGVDRQFYVDRLRNERRFRLFLCKPTQADIAFIMTRNQAPLGPRAVARACGLGFGRDALDRILLNKFMTQVTFIERRIARARETGQQLCFQIVGPPPVIQPPIALPDPHPVVAMPQNAPQPPLQAPILQPTQTSAFASNNPSQAGHSTAASPFNRVIIKAEPMEEGGHDNLDALAAQVGTQLNLS